MVLVEIYRINHEEIEGEYYGAEFYELGLAVVGFVPQDEAEALDFVTRWAETLEFDYIWEPDKELHSWGYILNELSRRKILLSVIPWNAHHIENIAEKPRYWVFVDMGSPARHIYFVKRDDKREYRIYGKGIENNEYIEIEVEFFESSIGFERCWDDKREELANDKNIHTDSYCDLKEEKKKLVNNIIKRSRIERERQKGGSK